MALRRTLMWGTAMGLAVALAVDPAGLSGLAGSTASAAEVQEDRATNLATAVGALSISEPAAVVPISGEYAITETSGALQDLPATTPIVDDVVTPVTTTPRSVDLGGMDVTVAALDAATPAEVRLDLLDGQTVADAGVDGVVMAVSSTGGDVTEGAELDLTVDYSTFAGLKGSDWSSRLQMVYIPACAATTPTDPDCLLQPLDTTNDPDEATLSAAVPVESPAAAPAAAATSMAAAAATTGGGRLAVIAGPSGSGGDWGATSLAPSSSWAQSGSSGGFTWAYPLPVTVAATGPVPQLDLTYSSSVSDGRTPESNNQSGWIGEGFDLSTGFIERSYVACDEDADNWAGRGEPNNHDRDSADLCWREDNAVLVFQGSSTELVKTGTDTWVPKADDGTVITHETGGSNDYWKVTTVEGTAYYFGMSKATEGATSGSAWTVPVYGNHAGEPCHASTFASSSCRTVWRWNIDKVVDTLGNEMTYSYVPETNYYVPDYTAGLDRDGTWYTSGGRLASISYGTPTSGSASLGKVVFDSAARCLTTRTNGRALCDTLSASVSERNWPDTPKDLQCTAAAGCENYSPVFFNTTRLKAVRAQVLDGSSYRTTDTWDFAQEFVAQGGTVRDTTSLILTLEKVTHTAAALVSGQSAITLPPVTFGYSFGANRLDTPTDGHARLIRPRLDSILTESRGYVAVEYATDPDCIPSKKPRNPSASAQAANTDFCYPVRWNPNRTKKTEVDWFHKYVVSSILEDGTPPSNASAQNPTELITGSLSKETFYEYDGAGWAKPSGPLIDASDSDLTSSDFRGARTVSQRVGSVDDNVSTRTTHYLGLGGTVTGGPANGQSASDSRPEMAGEVYSEARYSESPTDGEVRKISETLSVVDAAQAITGVISGHNARRVERSSSYSYTYLRNGSLEHSIQVTTDFDAKAQPVKVLDGGSSATTADDVCTVTTYASLGGNRVSFPSSITERAGDCTTGTILRRSGKTYVAATGQVLTETTMVSSSKTVTDATYTYDSRGRVTKTVDAGGNATDTAYTVNAVGQLTQITTTHPDPDGSGPTPRPVTRAYVDALSGVTTNTVDANGQETVGTYDALERILSVRYPQHATAPFPSIEYAYETRSNGANIFVTRKLAADGVSQHIAVEISDGLLRLFQTQTESRSTGPDRTWNKETRGRLVTHTLYDAAGRISSELGPWLAEGMVSRSAVVAELAPPSRTDYAYDLAGRVTSERFCVNTACNAGQEEWKTVTHYEGATTIVVPPQGGIPTASVVDRRGQRTKTVEYLRDSASATTSYSTIIGLPKQTTSYSYDGAGRMVGMTDPAGNQWTYQFDLAGRQTSATDPDSGTTSTVYNDLGQVTSRTDARGKGVTYEYDKLGRTIKKFHTGNATPQATWAYDTAPGAGGATTIGQLASSTRVSGGLTYASTVLGYDVAYQPTGVRTTLPASASLKALSGQSYDVGYTYTADGQVASTTLPKVTRPDGAIVLGKETVSTIFDSASMPHWQTGGFGWGTYVADSLFDAEARPLAMDLGNTYGAVVTYQWDEGTGRLRSLALDRERVDGTEIEVGYQYDDAGNVSSVIDAPANPAVAGAVDAQCYRYDALRRLKTMWTAREAECGAVPTSWSQVGGPAPGWTDFTYDVVGNRTSKTERSAAGSVVTASTFGSGVTGPHRLLSQTVTGQSAVSFSWDAAGNRTGRSQGASSSSFTWDAEGELVSSTAGSTSVSSVYDADGSRLVKFEGANVTVYLPGGMEVSSSSSTAVSSTRWYSFAGKTVAHRTGNGLAGVTSVVTDHQGTVVGTVHNTDWAAGVSRKRPDPFGGSRSSSSVTSQGRGFLGAVHDANALVLLGARYLDPVTGSFVSVDPLLDPLRPAHFNAYSYGWNNPVTWDDPSGLAPTVQFDGGVAGKYRPEVGAGTGAKGGASGGSSAAARAAGQSVAGQERTCSRGRVPVCAVDTTWPEVVAAVQGVLTVAGLVPGAGEAADGLSALICLGENDMTCAGLSAASMVPFLGWGAAGGRFGKVGSDLADASSNPSQSIFRHVSPAELDDIATHGFRPGSNSLEGKWFAESADDAKTWGHLLNRGKGAIVEVRTTKGFLARVSRLDRLDGVGPARYVAPEQLADLNGFARSVW